MPPFTCVNRISKLERCVTHQLLSHNGERVEPREEKSGKEGERERVESLDIKLSVRRGREREGR